MTHPREVCLAAPRLRELLHYDHTTGVFTWAVRKGQRVRVGDKAGSIDRKGYLIIVIDGLNYKAHRLACLYMTGRWPSAQIDHIDEDKSNNRWSNLRDVSQSDNQHNISSPRSNNKARIRGVHWHKKIGKWAAKITFRSVRHHLGYFSTETEAASAYLSFKSSRGLV